jgi:hypothetical protein
MKQTKEKETLKNSKRKFHLEAPASLNKGKKKRTKEKKEPYTEYHCREKQRRR